MILYIKKLFKIILWGNSPPQAENFWVSGHCCVRELIFLKHFEHSKSRLAPISIIKNENINNKKTMKHQKIQTKKYQKTISKNNSGRFAADFYQKITPKYQKISRRFAPISSKNNSKDLFFDTNL